MGELKTRLQIAWAALHGRGVIYKMLLTVSENECGPPMLVIEPNNTRQLVVRHTKYLGDVRLYDGQLLIPIEELNGGTTRLTR